MDDKTILVINFLIWLISLIAYYKMRKRCTVGVFVLLLYTTISYIAISLFLNPLGRGLFTPHVTMWPFVLLWGMILISMYPIFRWESIKVTEICLPNIRYVKYLCVGVVILCVIKIISLIPDVRQGVLMMASGMIILLLRIMLTLLKKGYRMFLPYLVKAALTYWRF